MAELDEYVRTALAVTRATGAPPLAVLLGMGPVWPTSAAVELRYAPDRPARAVPLGMPDVAMLADFALAGALRTRYGGGRSIPTVSLTVQLQEPVVPPDLRVRAWAGELADGLADAHGELVSAERVVGRALGSFVVRNAAEESRVPGWRRRWSAPTAEPIPVGELTEDERAMAQELLRAADEPPVGGGDGSSVAGADGRSVGGADGRPVGDGDGRPVACAAASPGTARSWTERLLEMSRDGSGWLPGPATRNRGGTVQGGVLFALAHAAAAAGAPAGARLVSGHVAYAAPAEPGVPITSVTDVAHATRRTLFVRAELRQAGRTVVIADFVLRGRARGHQPAQAARADQPGHPPPAS